MNTNNGKSCLRRMERSVWREFSNARIAIQHCLHITLTNCPFGYISNLETQSMKQLTIFLLASLISFQSIAKDDYSLVVYKTYEDYKSNNGEALHEFMGFEWLLGVLRVFYKVKRKGKDELWKDVTKSYGFSIGEQFYRIVKGKPYRVLMEGKLVYYENGLAHLNMLVGQEDEGLVEQGDWHVVSDNLNSEIIEFPSAKATKTFGERAELQALFECVEKLKKRKTEKVRKCVKENN